MRKYSLLLVLIFVFVLSGCGADDSANNFLIRKESYLISEDNTVLIEYKTDEDGKLVKVSIDRLLTIEEMIFYNTEIDYDYDLEGFAGEIFTPANYLCTDFEDLYVPINIEIGNTRFIYNVTECGYVEVDRDNEEKIGVTVRSYLLEETIDVSLDVEISIVVFDDNSIERFVEIQTLPHTMKRLGVYSIGFNLDHDDFSDGVINYYRDMAVYEQLLLKHQDSDLAESEISGISEDINLLSFSEFDKIIPLIEDFKTRYSLEIDAFKEVVEKIGVEKDEVEGTLNEGTPEE